jgi:CubicO group peptidase (beta-lactamase class C family)
LEIDTMMAIASCTKLITTIAALQCVERGQIGLDDDVAGFLPELARLEILTGMDSATGKPMLKKRENKITLR